MPSCGPMRNLGPLCFLPYRNWTIFVFYEQIYFHLFNQKLPTQLKQFKIINKSTNHIIYFINNQFSWYSKLYISCKILCNVLESMTKNSIINQAIDQFNQFNQSINSRLVFSLWLSAASCIKMVPQVLIGYISYTPGYKRSK